MNVTRVSDNTIRYSKLEIKRCRALDGRQVHCLWRPVYNQRGKVDLYSIQFIRQDFCPSVPLAEEFATELSQVATINTEQPRHNGELLVVDSGLSYF